MKPLIALLAMTLGMAFVGVILTIQHDRFAFTTRERASPVVHMAFPEPIDLTSLLSPVSVVRIDEVTVVGMLSRPPRERDVATDPPRVPAPCADGEYRIIDATRGVTLNCPPKPAVGF